MMIELYNALKFITMLFFIQKILTFNLGAAFLKSVSIYCRDYMYCLYTGKSKMSTKYILICLLKSLQDININL